MSSFNPSFSVDYNKCGVDPVLAGNAVQFGDSSSPSKAGRAISNNGYRNISKITSVIDLSGLNPRGQWQGNFVNAAFYMVCNPHSPAAQPIHGQYCDAGGNCALGSPNNCREIDFLETNGNKIFQATVHLGDGGQNAPQRFEYAYTDAANNGCYNWGNMKNDPSKGLHSLSGIIDVSKPFNMAINFDLINPKMMVSVSQISSVVIYDSTAGPGAEGSGTLNMSDLIATMSKGYWIVCSFWQGYSPKGPGSSVWWNDSCKWDSLCGQGTGFWSIHDITVDAEGTV